MIMSDLPPDLVEEILSRVPATSLKRLRTSCKRWNTLFKDQRFAKKHFLKAQRQSHVLMFSEPIFHPVNVDLSDVPAPVEFKDELRLKESEQVYISDFSYCDGLLLCTTNDNRLVVWNPCLGETRWIQYYVNYKSRFFLGYANTKSGRSYRIMRCNETLKDAAVGVCEFGSDSWKVLDEVTLGHLELSSGCVSIKGNIYWTSL